MKPRRKLHVWLADVLTKYAHQAKSYIVRTHSADTNLTCVSYHDHYSTAWTAYQSANCENDWVELIIVIESGAEVVLVHKDFEI